MPKIIMIAKKIRNFYEVVLPCLSLAIVFIAFILQIFMRYVCRRPLMWTQEIETWFFIWTVFCGCNYMTRENEHVRFGLVYDALGKKGKLILQIVGNLIIFAAYAILISYTVAYVFGKNQTTGILRISLTIVYIPVILFVIGTVFYSALDLIKDVRSLLHPENHKESEAV